MGSAEVSQVEALTDEDIAAFFVDARKAVVDDFLPVDVEKVETSLPRSEKRPPTSSNSATANNWSKGK